EGGADDAGLGHVQRLRRAVQDASAHRDAGRDGAVLGRRRRPEPRHRVSRRRHRSEARLGRRGSRRRAAARRPDRERPCGRRRRLRRHHPQGGHLPVRHPLVRERPARRGRAPQGRPCRRDDEPLMGVDDRARGNAAVAALLLAQACVGYEWLLSGVTKLAHGDFPGGLHRQLAEMGTEAPGWYRAFLGSAVAPHAHAFGYAIETVELLIGVVLLGTAAALLLGRPRWERALRLAAGGAAGAGLVLLVNFELANGAGFGLRLAAESFDEGL